jgi:uncharacterized membrane protein YeaQ/YmgE (transglycosylase-associated protein family)
MSLEMFVTWVVVGLFTGWVAGVVMKDGGYGLISDLTFGLVGGGVAIGIYSVLGGTSDGGRFAVAAAVTFVGAALVIVAQRKMYAHA